MTSPSENPKNNGDPNKLKEEDCQAHDWYRFVLSYPPHLVRDYVKRFGLTSGQTVLDPFCGTGTTVVECKKLGIASIGIEAHPMLYLASKTKVDWSPEPNQLLDHARRVADKALSTLDEAGISDEPSERQNAPKALRTLPEEVNRLLLKGSISPLPLHKTLVLLKCLEEERDERFYDHERLALAKALVSVIGNIRFGPEVGVTKPKQDAAVVGAWLELVRVLANDLSHLKNLGSAPADIINADARQVATVLGHQSVDAVITSPPYPNEKDYTRTTRLESVLLGLIRTRAQLQHIKRDLIRSNTRNVYKGDDDNQWIKGQDEIEQIAEEIEARRIQLGKTSGFERLYAQVTRLYFGGMARHLNQLKAVLRPGAQLAYVVGDQASYLRVMIRTGQLLGKVATSFGYELVDIDLFRTRFATVTGEEMREEVVVLLWPGERKSMWGGVSVPKAMSFTSEDKYGRIIEWIFHTKYTPGASVLEWERRDITTACTALRTSNPKNLGDVIYTFRYRRQLPDSIQQTAPEGKEWVIRGRGDAAYQFELASMAWVKPNQGLTKTKVPEATPGIIAKYALSDEQALLAKLRYNRLLDTFTGVTCYSLQNHLRTKVPDIGQVETDEVYVGVDKKGVHYVFPVQAKGGSDMLSVVQIEQDFGMCAEKFPGLVCRPIATQFMSNDLIAVFEFELQDGDVRICSEQHYQLVSPDEISPEDLEAYRRRIS